MIRAPHILLIPEALLPDGGDVRGMCRDKLVECLFLPECVIGRMGRQLPPISQLVEAVRLGVGAWRTCFQKCLVIIIGATWYRISFALLLRLSRDVVHVGFAERAIMKPVV